jgi:hypothetical protein
MTAKRIALSLTVSLVALLCFAGVAQAAGCTGDTWYGPHNGVPTEGTSGAWGDASDWSAGVPSGNTQVCITLPGTYTVSLKPYFGSNNRVDLASAENLTLGAGSGTQTLRVIGENWNALGDQENQTGLFVGYGMRIAPGGVLSLDAGEGVSEGGTGAPAGGNAFVEQDVLNQPGHPFINEGTIVAERNSSKWTDWMHIHSLANHGSLQVTSPLRLDSEESSSNTGSIGVAAGASVKMYNLVSFTNEGPVSNNGTLLLSGYTGDGKWIQGPSGSVSGAGVEDTSSSGAGAFTFIGSGSLLGTVPKSQTITLTSAGGQDTLYLGNGTLVNEGTLHLDVPAGSENNTNVEEGSLVNRGTISGTVEGTHAKNVIDVALENEPGGVVSASSGTLFDNRTLTNNSLIQVAPSAILEIVATTFVNGSAGVIAPQIAAASSFGLVKLYSNGTLEAGGTVAPTPVGGFTPSVGEEFDVFEGPVKGSFAAISGGFSADYSHQTAENSYVGVVYGAASTGSTGTTGNPGTTTTATTTTSYPTVSAIKSAKGNLTVTLSCPAGGGSCATANILATVTEHLKGSKLTAITAAAKSKKKKSKTTTKQVAIASSGATLAAGATKTITLALNATGKKLLAKYGKLSTIVTITVDGKVIASGKQTLVEPSKSKTKKRK